MNIKDAVVLITGANRGLGLSLAKALLDAGARKVYAGARDPASVTLAGVEAIKLDVTSASDIAAAVKATPDVNVVINNAGIERRSTILAPGAAQAVREELETNFFGPLALSQAYAPVLAANGGGAIVNVLSALSWISMPQHATYSTTKSAAWSLTNALRNELAGQQTRVVGVHVGYMETGMTDTIDAPKANPADVALAVVKALAAGDDEVLADDTARYVKANFNGERSVYLGEKRP